MSKQNLFDDLAGDDLDGEQLVSVEHLADEFIQSLRGGDSPTIQQYLEWYPRLAKQIQELFPTVLMMEQARDQSLTHRRDGRVLQGSEPIRQLGDFRIVREIGRGGMGIVYEAEQESLGRRVAVKVLPRVLFDAAQIQRFEREARLAARLHHTNIVPIYGLGQVHGLNYFVMQLIEGDSLGVSEATEQATSKARSSTSQLFNRLGRNAICKIGRQVGFALDYAHKKGVLHCDIKPGNLILDAQQNVWVTDFGLAVSRQAVEAEEQESISGTLRYLPPEKLNGAPDTPQTDIYSLGISLIELLTQRPAFEFQNRDQLIEKICRGDVLAAGRHRRQIPSDLRAVLRKSVAVDPQQRYGSAREMAIDLQNFMEDRPVSCRKHSARYKTARWIRRNPYLATMTAITGMTLLVFSLISTQSFFRMRTLLKSEQRHRQQVEVSSEFASEALDKIFFLFSPDSKFSEYNSASDSDSILSAPVAPLDQPVLTDEVVVMLEELLVFYQQLASRETITPELVFRALSARCRVGEINERLGHYEAAVQAYEQALVGFERMPNRPRYRLQIARLCNQSGFVNRMIGNHQEANAYYERAIDEIGTYGQRNAYDPLIKLELARSHYFLGHPVRPGFDLSGLPPEFFGKGGQREPVSVSLDLSESTHLGQAIEILNSIDSETQTITASVQHLLALCFRELANDSWQQRSDQELDSEHKSILILENLVDDFPHETIYRFELMQTLAEINVFECDLKLTTLQTAHSAITRAIQLGETLVHSRPDVVSYRVALIHANFKLATIIDRMIGQLDENQIQVLESDSEPFYRNALDGQRLLVRRYPESHPQHVWLARFQLSLANCPGLRGDRAERNRLIGLAIAELVRLPESVKSQPQVQSMLRETNPLID